jgi:hypothetical protein
MIHTYRSCRFYLDCTSDPCGKFNGREELFTVNELESKINYIEGVPINDFQLVKSRSKGSYPDKSYPDKICPRHYQKYCQNYEPEPYCQLCPGTTDLKKIGVRAAEFFGSSTPICEYCVRQY